jgi:CheY-like chemotaxis protein
MGKILCQKVDVEQSLRGVGVLVVEDSADSRLLLTRILTRYGADVQAVGSAAEALAKLAHSRPDVIVSDISMPGMDGYDLMRHVREDLEKATAHRIPAIALSGHGDSLSRSRSLSGGFQVHLTKPVNNLHLVSTVARLAERHGEVSKDADAPVDRPPPPYGSPV